MGRSIKADNVSANARTVTAATASSPARVFVTQKSGIIAFRATTQPKSKQPAKST